MCTYPVQPICTFSCTSMFILIFINPQYTVLHILSHCRSHSLFYYLFLFSFSPIFIYILLCYVSLIIFLFFYFPLSRPVLTYISLLIIPCMIVYVTNNKEPWTYSFIILMSVLIILVLQMTPNEHFEKLIWQLTEKCVRFGVFYFS